MRVFDKVTSSAILFSHFFVVCEAAINSYRGFHLFFSSHALDPKKGERILDMCAAPGGKTTAIAILMRDEGEIIAADRSHNKVILLSYKVMGETVFLFCSFLYNFGVTYLRNPCSLKSNGDKAQLFMTLVSCRLGFQGLVIYISFFNLFYAKDYDPVSFVRCVLIGVGYSEIGCGNGPELHNNI